MRKEISPISMLGQLESACAAAKADENRKAEEAEKEALRKKRQIANSGEHNARRTKEATDATLLALCRLGRATTRQIADRLQLGCGTVRQRLDGMAEKGVVMKFGERSHTEWELVS